MDEILHKTVGDIGIDCLGIFIADGVRHTSVHRFRTDSSVVGMRSRATLLLHIPAAIERIGEVSDTGVHHRVYLLHPSLNAVVMEVCPRHARHGTAAGQTGAEFLPDNHGLDHGTKMLLIIVPFRLHILDFVGVRQDYLVKLGGVEDGEVEGCCTLGNILDKIHTCLEFT